MSLPFTRIAPFANVPAYHPDDPSRRTQRTAARRAHEALAARFDGPPPGE